MRLLSFVVMLILVALGVVFAVLNPTPVTLNYYVNTLHLPLALLLSFALLIGVIVAWLVMLPWVFRYKYALRRLQRQIAQNK